MSMIGSTTGETSESTAAPGGEASTSVMLRSFQIEPFDPRKAKWTRWVDRLEGAFHLFGIPESSYLPTLLHFVGAEAYDVVADSLAPVKPYKSTYDEVVRLLEEHYNPKTPEIKAIFEFMSRKQRNEHPRESVDQFVEALRELAEPCNFGEYLNKALRNQFVFGLAQRTTQKKMLEMHCLTLDGAIKLAKSSGGFVAKQRAEKSVKHEKVVVVSQTYRDDEHSYSSEQGFAGFQDQFTASVAESSTISQQLMDTTQEGTMDILEQDIGEVSMALDRSHREEESDSRSESEPEYAFQAKKRRYLKGLKITAQDVRDVLNDTPTCHELVNLKLKDGMFIGKNDKSLVNRTICRYFLGRQIKTGMSISNTDKQRIAEAIVAAYPCLGSTDPNRPAESEWFWYKNGEQTGNHTGSIQHWVRNTMSKAQFEGKQRKTKIGQPPPETEELQSLVESPENRTRIFQLMTETFPYRQALRVRRKVNSDMANSFPHLLQHGGEMLDHEFNLMFPNRKPRTFESIIPLCLVLDGNFKEISNVAILAMLKVMNTLSNITSAAHTPCKKADPLGLTPLEEYASVLIRWCQDGQDLDDVLMTLSRNPPFVFIDAAPFGDGDFHAIVEGTAYNCGEDFCRALDLVMKAYKVFRYQTETRAKRVIHFFDVSVYNVYKFSPLTIVNNLCDRMKVATSNHG